EMWGKAPRVDDLRRRRVRHARHGRPLLWKSREKAMACASFMDVHKWRTTEVRWFVISLSRSIPLVTLRGQVECSQESQEDELCPVQESLSVCLHLLRTPRSRPWLAANGSFSVADMNSEAITESNEECFGLYFFDVLFVQVVKVRTAYSNAQRR